MDQGGSFSVSINLKDDNDDSVSLDGYIARADIKKHANASKKYSLSATIDENIITLSLTSTETRAIPAGRYYYDCEIESPSQDVLKVLRGVIEIYPGITEVE